MPHEYLGSFGAIRAPVEPDSPRYPRVARSVQLPKSVALRIPTATHDQGALGSCVGQAWAKALEIEYGNGVEISALACYYWARYYSNPAWETQDTGALMAPSIDAMKQVGAGSESMWPYEVALFAKRPPADYALQALDHKVVEAHRALTVQEVRSALHAGHPIVTAFDVPPNWPSDGLWADDGRSPAGGHAVTFYGYDDDLVAGPGYAPGSLLGVNSWSDAFGEQIHGENEDGGSFRVPYSSFEKARGRWFDGIVVDTFDREAGR